MEENNPKVNQKAEGEGIAQAAGTNATAVTIFGVPLVRTLTTFFIGSIVFQCLGYCCALNLNDPSFSVTVCGFCYPVFFGLPAFFGFFYGIALRNRDITLLSLLSGIISLSFVILLRTVGVWNYFKLIDLFS